MSEVLEPELLERLPIKRWTTDEYLKIADAGVFDGQRVELIDGEICEMAPMNEGHAVGTDFLTAVLIRKLPRNFHVRNQAPLYLGEGNVPEPDIAVVDIEVARNYARPTTAHLIVETSDATLRYDQNRKASLYAWAQIAEYWILNVRSRTLEVYREPVEDASQAFGWKYNSKRELRGTESVSPLCAPEVALQIGEFLP